MSLHLLFAVLCAVQHITCYIPHLADYNYILVHLLRTSNKADALSLSRPPHWF